MSGDARSLANPAAAVAWGERYLHMADGMYFGDEEVGGDHTASRGTETCSVVETMNSMRVAYEVSGNVTFMDRLETLAFNSLPAARRHVQHGAHPPRLTARHEAAGLPSG